MISVLIASKDRHSQLIDCIKSILNNDFNNYEIIIIDQTINKWISNLLQNKKIRYYHRPGKGKSHALNYAISQAKGDILAFTDDDCIVDQNWLTNIKKYFAENNQVDGIFGQTYPYQPEKHKNLICPAVTKPKYFITNNPSIIFEKKIGKGNNMAWQKQIFNKSNTFKTWLGPGTNTTGAEETEFAYRNLLNKRKIGFCANIICYHNNWITKEAQKDLLKKKKMGEIMFQSYYFFKNNDFLLLKKTFSHDVNFFVWIKCFLIGLKAYLTGK